MRNIKLLRRTDIGGGEAKKKIEIRYQMLRNKMATKKVKLKRIVERRKLPKSNDCRRT